MGGSKFLIYGLVDPRDGGLRYIGKSSSGLKRPRCHSMPSQLRQETNPKSVWIRELLDVGHFPVVVVLFETDRDLLAKAEKFWITYFKRQGAPLLNCSKGGEGSVFWYQTPEAKEKIRRARRGMVYTEAQCRRMSISRGGRPFENQYGAVFHTLREAAEALGVSESHVGDVLEGRLNKTGGYSFRYV